MRYFGLLNINKPPGITSRRVVDHVARLVRPAKAGHAGTLDPLATGVLVVCVGPATRLIDYVQRAAKRYTATFLLGRHSETEDVEGDVVELANPPIPTLEQIQQAIPPLVGQVLQRPPAFSALKLSGRRAYDLARAGQTVELAPRSVTIHSIDIVSYTYPELMLEVCCGSGTYVRSLGRDIAESLGTAAVMSALVRTQIGPFRISESRHLDQLTAETLDNWLLPARLAVKDLPTLELSEAELRRIGQGMSIARDALPDANEFAAVDARGELAAILLRQGDRLRPSINLRGI
jgi:tRNA pseudouridine55 synthase